MVKPVAKVEEVTVETLCKWYEDSVDSTIEARRLAERDRDYVDGKQWTPEEVATLNARGQPVITTNKIKPKVNFLLGTERQTRTDPKAFPREPGDEKGAEAATDALRYVADCNDFDQIKSDAFENMVVEGYCGGITEVDAKLEVKQRRIPWDRLFFDPHSSERNFSDAKYMGMVVWLDLDEAVELFGPEAEQAYNWCESNAPSETYSDKPKTQWIDTKRQRLFVVEIYFRDKGVWKHSVFNRGNYLKAPHPSDYLDEDNKPMNPIELQSCYIDRDNNRYGVVRGDISPQDEINKRRSKALHLISQRQFMYEQGALTDVKKAKQELAKPDGAVEYNPGFKMELLNTNDMATGNFNMLAIANADLDSAGANAALQGRDSPSASGRAIQAKQQGGLVELGPVFDGIRNWQKRMNRQAWCRIKQYWTAPKWIRVTDDEDNLKYVGLNQQLTQGQQILEDAKADGLPPDQLAQLEHQLAMDPRSMQPITRNDVKAMNMDLILSEQPDTVNLQGETYEGLVQMFTAAPDKVPFEVVIEASPLRQSIKKKILDAHKPNPQAQQAQMQAQQEAMEIQKAGAIAEVKNTEADTAQKVASAQLSQAKVGTEQANAAKAQVDALATLLNPTPGTSGERAASDTGEGRINGYS